MVAYLKFTPILLQQAGLPIGHSGGHVTSFFFLCVVDSFLKGLNSEIMKHNHKSECLEKYFSSGKKTELKDRHILVCVTLEPETEKTNKSRFMYYKSMVYQFLNVQGLRYVAAANDHNLAINKHIFANLRKIIIKFILLHCLILAYIWLYVIKDNEIKVKDIFQLN